MTVLLNPPHSPFAKGGGKNLKFLPFIPPFEKGGLGGIFFIRNFLT